MREHKSAFKIGVDMRRSFLFVALLLIISMLCGCSKNGNGIIVQKPTVAFEAGISTEMAFEELNAQSEYSEIKYNHFLDAVVALENGKTDYAIVDSYQLESLEKSDVKIKVEKELDFKTDYCLYFSSKGEQLRERFDFAIKELKNDGTFEIIKKAFIQSYEYDNTIIDPVNGKLVMLCVSDERTYDGVAFGMDFYMIREITAMLGYELDFVIVDFDELFIKLENGEGDFVGGAVEYTPERADLYLASESYYSDNYYLVTNE